MGKPLKVITMAEIQLMLKYWQNTGTVIRMRAINCALSRNAYAEWVEYQQLIAKKSHYTELHGKTGLN